MAGFSARPVRWPFSLLWTGLPEHASDINSYWIAWFGLTKKRWELGTVSSVLGIIPLSLDFLLWCSGLPACNSRSGVFLTFPFIATFSLSSFIDPKHRCQLDSGLIALCGNLSIAQGQKKVNINTYLSRPQDEPLSHLNGDLNFLPFSLSSSETLLTPNPWVWRGRRFSMASLKDHNAEEPTLPLEGEYSAVIDIRWRLMTQTLAPDLKTASRDT